MSKSMRVGFVVTFAAMSTMSGYAQSLSDGQIEAAIKAGQEKRYSTFVSECVATPAFSEKLAAVAGGGVQRDQSFDVVVSRNAGKIATLAADAKRHDRSFGLADVPVALKDEPAVFVTVSPQGPRMAPGAKQTISVASPIWRVVLKSKAAPDSALRPRRFQTDPVSWTNVPGEIVTANRASAVFSVADVETLPAGEFDVVVITQHGERRCKVAAKDRARLFASTPGMLAER